MAKRRTFGNTWWGKAWLDALEQRALVDPNRLPRGRTYARQDRVRSLELSPGELRASVWGNRPNPYLTTLSLRTLSDDEWDRILDTIMEKASNTAALLAGEVPADIGAFVLPDRGDLGPDCSCPDWAEPCKHAAALCYIAADLFDGDPFALLTLRGRSREQVLTEVRARRGERLGVKVPPPSDQPRGADPGTSASKAYRRQPVPLNRSPRVPASPAKWRTLAVAPSADAGIDLDDLTELVNDATERAWAMLAGGTESGLQLSIGADVVRRAARADAIPALIAQETGVELDELRAAVAAWKIGGHRGFTVHRASIEVDSHLMQPALAALGPDAKQRNNAASLGPMQLRLDEGGRWWRFSADDELGWLLVDGPSDDPVELL